MLRATIYTVLSLVSIFSLNACKKSIDDATPTPDPPAKVVEASYFTGYNFDPKELDDDETRLLVKFCKDVTPDNMEIGVYELAPGTNLDDALMGLLLPAYDDDGELIERDTPDYYVQVQAKYTTPEGTKLSDFNKEKEFVVDIDRSNPVILMYEDAGGFLQYVTVDPSGLSRDNPPHVCLKGS